MYVYVSSGGATSFRYDYRFNGRRETVTLGPVEGPDCMSGVAPRCSRKSSHGRSWYLATMCRAPAPVDGSRAWIAGPEVERMRSAATASCAIAA